MPSGRQRLPRACSNESARAQDPALATAEAAETKRRGGDQTPMSRATGCVFETLVLWQGAQLRWFFSFNEWPLICMCVM